MPTRSRDLAARLFPALFGDAEASFWLDSSLPHPRLGRLSILGTADGPHGSVYLHRVSGPAAPPGGFYPELRGRLAATARPIYSYDDGGAHPALPGGFSPGLVCALGYGLGMDGRGQGAEAQRPQAPPLPPVSQPDSLPDAALMAPSRLVVIDHFTGEVALLAAGELGDDRLPDPDSRAWLDDAARLAGELAHRDSGSAGEPERADAPEATSTAQAPGEFALDASRDEYLEAIARCQDAIGRGEAYEICLTNTARGPAIEDPLGAYQRLRRHTPAPFGAYLRFGQTALLGASPERFLRVDPGGAMETRPIKGTRPRGTDATADRALREDLASNDKDRAENLMIVDLLRNDLGRVSELGSVHVPRLCEVESFSHVHQLVSTITGRLAPGRDLVDAIAATFPGGSMTGAPKRRAMDLCARIEPRPRGLYSGALGWLAPDGSADLAITIRTAVTGPRGTSIGVGGAILAPSDPEAEWVETLVKLRPVLDALGAHLTE
ncbi:MAG TPA: aminodeoxychorismate synthase component I [Dietzia timorensis]|uniref:Aminodeoxychorismate synthase component I n=1 Tax=Dietzia timorensis TaxID=499555 RepID=A0A921F183_9ACTN|nr:aminodeoxychorismate synthase component I [Dietzia timorensis]HJE89936.1 aminodeoxychorismate synthase component I [Dietzia timorensis]